MKRFPLLILLAGVVLAQTPAAHQVYVMPMAGGLDQHLADWLTREHVMRVVTDAKAADVVLTDRLGEAFEQKLAQLKPEMEKPVEKTPADKKTEIAGAGVGGHVSFRSTAARGTLFLVDVKTRVVLWSDHQKPRGTSDKQINHQAERAVKNLQGLFSGVK